MPASNKFISKNETLFFHPGEQALQERLRVRERMAELGSRVIRDYMPEQHRELFEKLPMLVIGALDQQGRPWATLLTGQPGFIKTPNSYHLELETNSSPIDPIIKSLKIGSAIGLLGIEMETRRRNRVNAEVISFHDRKLRLRVKQSFGNCSRYIQKRRHYWQKMATTSTEVKQMSVFNDSTRKILLQSDSFFISSLFDDGVNKPNRGLDVSHRGGLPGFIHFEDERTLIFPDYSGNHFFNTLGNIQLNPLVGILFIEYESGSLVHLTGRAEILWDDTDIKGFIDAERIVRFRLDQAQLRSNALPLRWEFLEYSPQLLKS